MAALVCVPDTLRASSWFAFPSVHSEEQMPSGSKLSLGYFLKIYVAAFLLCLIYNTIWDLVYTG